MDCSSPSFVPLLLTSIPQRPLGAVACRPLFLLTCALLLTSSHSKAEADRIGARVRLSIVASQQSTAPQPELALHAQPCTMPSAQCGSLPWSRANRTNIQGFSALGWYTARQLYAMHGEAVPIGIVQSDVPGTPIQKWSSASTILECYHGPAANASAQGASHLYNGMIYPLLNSGLVYTSTVWYQGESNVGAPQSMDGAAYYQCALPAMIKGWRAASASALLAYTPASASTPLSASVPASVPALPAQQSSSPQPFFVVELAAYCNEHDEATFRTFCDSNTTTLTGRDYHLPAMRVAQAAALAVPNVYMSSAMDLGSLHPLPYVLHDSA